MDTEMISIGSRLKARRKELGLTQTDIHAKCGIASGAMSQIENGTRTPSAITLYNLAQVLECSMEWLITGNSTDVKNGKFYRKEEELLNGFRELNLDDQEEIMGIIAMKLKRVQRDENNVRSSSLDHANRSDKLA
ncbi:MAG: helix-turn-helix domain-containing protein [Suipraeoptans sp.]